MGTSFGWARPLYVVLLLCGSVLLPWRASADAPDERWQNWAALYNQGKLAELAASVESDLRSAAPHPRAPRVWLAAHRALGDSPVQAAAALDRAAQTALGALPDIVQADLDDRNDERLLDRFRSDAVSTGPTEVLSRLADNATEVGQPLLAFHYLADLARNNPQDLNIAWSAVYAWESDVAPQAELERARDALLPLLGGDLAQLLRRLLVLPRPTGADEAVLLEEWRKTHPDDLAALHWLSVLLARLQHDTDAEAVLKEVEARDPFNGDTVSNHASVLAHQGRTQEAEQLLARYGWLRKPGQDPAQRQAELLAAALRSGGERGAAERVLNAALVRWPDDVELLRERALLEDNNGRWRQAADAAQSILARDPTDANAFGTLTYALMELKDAERALQARRDFLAAGGRETYVSRNNIVLTLNNADRAQEALDLGTQWLAEHPHAFYVVGNTADALRRLGRTDEAVAAFRLFFAWHPPTRYFVDRFIEALEATGGDVEAELKRLRTDWPRDYDVWTAADGWLASRDPDKSLRRQLWQEAVAAAPDIEIFWVELADLDVEKAPDLALGILRQGRTAVAASPPSLRANLLRYRADIAAAAMEHYRIEADPVLMSELLADMETFRALRESLGAYHRVRWRLFTIEDNLDAARAEAIARAAADPSDVDAVWKLTTGNIPSVPIIESFGRLPRLIDRNPYDSQTIVLAVRMYALYGAKSPVHAIRVAQRADNIDLSAGDRAQIAGDIAHAYGDLGDAQDQYRREYGKVSSIANSQRYINWFDYARIAAQKPGTIIKNIDVDHLTAIALSPDGIEVEAHWDAITAWITYYRVGAAWIAASYEGPKREVSHLWDSAGTDIRLYYDGKGQIARLLTKDGTDVSFVYNARGNMTVISLVGVGAINVTYNDQNEIEHVESSAGRSMALKVMSTFQSLLGLTRSITGANFVNAPELPFKDDKLQQLEDAADRVQSRSATMQAEMGVARYLLAHLQDRRFYATRAEEAINTVWDAASVDRNAAALGTDAVGLWYDLQARLRPDGLPDPEWQRWAEMQSWLERQSPKDSRQQARVAALLARVKAKPLKLLPSVAWLPRSYIDTDGFWQRTSLDTFVPRDQVGRLLPQAALVRHNGDLVVGTNLGLLVQHAGFWRWYGFDEVGRAWVPTPSTDRLRSSSDVQALAEDAGGKLWVGTASGLIETAGDYTATAQPWIVNDLPAPRVTALAPWMGGVLVGTPRGLRVRGEAGASALPPALSAWAGREVKLLRTFATGPEQQDAFVVCVGNGATVLFDPRKGASSLGGDPLVDAAWDASERQLYLLYPDRLDRRSLDGGGAAERVPGFNQVLQARRLNGLGVVPFDGGTHVVTVLSDEGLSFYREAHFEAKKLPLTDHLASAQLLTSAGGRTLVVSDAGLYVLEHDTVVVDHGGKVDDLLVDEQQHVTFVARGRSRLEVVRHEAVRDGPQPLAFIAVDRLARDGKGGLLANDGAVILRFAPGSTTSQELFRLEPASDKGDPRFRRVTSLLVAGDDTVWVTYGASVFRWREGDEKPEEFSTYVDPKRFPGRTDAVSQVLQTVDGRIWVVASNESHISERGEALTGGLLEWDGQAFHRLDDMSSTRWFITGYTPLGDGSAVVGTSAGFARHRGGFYASIEERGEESYLALKQRNPMLFLGTEGAKIGDSDIWLFGTAGGLIAYEGGRWITPDRLNWMLPDQDLAQYGARAVHAVATDSVGHIYAGTDRGLLIYDSGGGDPNEFLVANNLADLAFTEIEQEKQREQSEAMLSALDSQSPLGRLYHHYTDQRREIEQLRSVIGAGTRVPPAMAPSPQPLLDSSGRGDLSLGRVPDQLPPAEVLRQRLDQLETANKKLMKEIESDPLLRSEVRLDPFDLRALRDQLDEGDVVVQLLPTTTHLHINVVRRGSDPVERDVVVSKEEIYRRVDLVRATLAARARGSAPEGSAQFVSDTELTEHLSFLYDHLLAPVEGLLEGTKHVFVTTSTGPLAYLPFGALVRKIGPNPEYAASRWSIGYLPTLYLLEALRREPSNEPRTLILANPADNLAGAEAEARALYSLRAQSTDMKLGPQASLAALMEFGPAAGRILFATHGLLNARDPGASYLLLAGDKLNDQRLTVAAITSLDLKRTDLVVLSACETAVGGRDGLEYATIARAFGHAGVPSVVATLWKVADAPTTRLIQAFFRAYYGDSYVALAAAQRDMIKAGGPMARPAAWAGFIPIGRP